jgi:hypothetical protein
MQWNLLPRLWPGVLFVWVGLLYRPGLEGGVYLDDFVHLVDNPWVKAQEISWLNLLRAADSSTAGPTGRPLSMLSFWGDYLLHGGNFFWMKAVNLCLHLLSGGLSFLLLRHLLPRLGASTAVAAVASFLWLVHPLHVSAVLYLVQRMTLLASVFMLLGLLGYSVFRARGQVGLALLALGAGTGLAVFAKENGLLALVYAWLIEGLVFRFTGVSAQGRRVLVGVFGAGSVMLGVSLGIYLALHPDWFTQAYAGREFTAAERLLTQARVLAFYQSLIVLPDLRQMGLYHDDYPLSHSLLDPPSTLLACLWHGGLVWVAVAARHKRPLISFGILWFYASHALESTFWPLELVFEHRNYLAVLGVLLAGYGLGQAVGERLALDPAQLARRLSVGFGAFGLLLSAATWVRASDWGDFFGHALMEAERHPQSARSHLDAGNTLLLGMIKHPEQASPELLARARQHLWRAVHLSPNRLPPLVSLLAMGMSFEQRLDTEALSALLEYLQTAKPHADTSLNLHYLIKQLLNEHTGKLLKPHAKAIFEAGLRNKRFGPRERAELLVGKALYLGGEDKPAEAILPLLEEACSLMPQVLDYQILFAAKLIDARDYTKAKQVLDRLARQDRLQIVSEEIARLRQYLN